MNDAWLSMLDTVMDRVTIQFVKENVIPQVKRMTKGSVAAVKRIRGVRLALLTAKNVGEKGFNSIRELEQIIENLVFDNNYNIRLLVIQFFKDYLPDVDQQSERFKEFYLPMIQELLHDDMQVIKIKTLEIFVDFLKFMPESFLNDDFLPNFLKCLKAKDDGLQLMSKLIGEFANALNDCLGDYSKPMSQILDFY